MHYIILDMEWDSAYFVPQKRFLNQILQIGAVKLDENFNLTDTFEVNVRSAFSKRVSRRFTELTGITKEMMLSGVPFSKAVDMYNDFVGEDSVTMTWSTSDLYTIIANEKTLLDGKRFKMDKYLDLQKFVEGELALIGHKCESQISLFDAAQLFNVTTDGIDFHTAKDDSLVGAMILKRCYNKERFEALVKDTGNPDFFNRLLFKPHYISDLKSEKLPSDTFEFLCPFCNSSIVQKKKWHFKNRNFSAEFYCENCNKKLLARVCAREYFNDIKIKKKIFQKSERPKVENDLQSLSEKM